MHFIELFIDAEMKEAICDRFGLLEDLNPGDSQYSLKYEIALKCFLGYDYIRCGAEDVGIRIERMAVQDTAALLRGGGRQFVNQHRGPITSWAEFEAYPWPHPASITTQNLPWYQENPPEDMCIIGSSGFAVMLNAAKHLLCLAYRPFDALRVTLFLGDEFFISATVWPDK